MLLSRILFLYLARNFLASLLVITGLIGACIFFANIFDTINRLKFTIVPVGKIAELAFLKLPYVINELLPICVLLACLSFFEKLSKRNELVIIFSDGISVWKFIQPVIMLALLLGIFSITILQPIASFSLSKQERLEQKLTGSKKINSVSLAGGMLYISEAIENQNRIYIAKAIDAESSRLLKVTILSLDKNYHFINRLDAPVAVMKNSKIELTQGAREIDKQGASLDYPYLSFPTHLDFRYILDRFAAPENISFWKLDNLSIQLVSSGIKADRYISYYYKLLFKPIYIISIVLVAVCFINLNPRGRVGVKILGIGGIIGLVIHSFREITSAFLMANNLGFATSQLIPSVIIITFASTWMLQKFDT